jgi:hypothetical protein
MKKKNIKAWAITSNGELCSGGRFYQPQITILSKAMAKEIIKNSIYVIGKGYKPKIVPCKITL